MDARPDRGSRVAGYAVVLLGVVGFVAGCFLPYLGGPVIPSVDTAPSLYRLVSGGPGTTFERAAGVLYLFVGAAIVGAIALWGIGRPRTWTPRALVAGVAVWTLTWVGILVSQSPFGSREFGYWVLLASLSVAAVGTIVVWVTSRGHEHEPIPGASPADLAGRPQP
jgi:hypothetical protein